MRQEAKSDQADPVKKVSRSEVQRNTAQLLHLRTSAPDCARPIYSRLTSGVTEVTLGLEKLLFHLK